MLLTILLAVVLLPLVFLNVIAPLLIFKVQKLLARVTLTPLPEADFLPARSETFNRMDAALKRMGFIYAGSSTLRDTHAETFFSMYSLPGDSVMAMLVTIASAVKSITYLEFSQLYDDGSMLDVCNADTVSSYPPMDLKLMLRYPDINEPEALFAVFNKLRKSLKNSVQPVAWSVEQGISIAENSLARESDELVRLGYGKEPIDENGKRNLTLKGAFIMTWKSVFPGKQIQNARDIRKAQRFLRQA